MPILGTSELPSYTMIDDKLWNSDWELIYNIPHALGSTPLLNIKELVALFY